MRTPYHTFTMKLKSRMDVHEEEDDEDYNVPQSQAALPPAGHFIEKLTKASGSNENDINVVCT